MVSKVLWDQSATPSSIMTTALNSLADNTISGASSVVDNAANLDTMAWLELNVTYGTAPSDANPSVDVYIAESLDGTNYQDAPVTGGTDQAHLFMGSFPVRKVTSAQRLVIGPFAIPPSKFKLYLDNQTGQAMAATGNTLDIKVANLEGQ